MLLADKRRHKRMMDNEIPDKQQWKKHDVCANTSMVYRIVPTRCTQQNKQTSASNRTKQTNKIHRGQQPNTVLNANELQCWKNIQDIFIITWSNNKRFFLNSCTINMQTVAIPKSERDLVPISRKLFLSTLNTTFHKVVRWQLLDAAGSLNRRWSQV